jgi:hypothetical protein
MLSNYKLRAALEAIVIIQTVANKYSIFSVSRREKEGTLLGMEKK